MLLTKVCDFPTQQIDINFVDSFWLVMSSNQINKEKKKKKNTKFLTLNCVFEF